MASNYTCRACSRALSRSSPLTAQAKQALRNTSLCTPSQSRRSLVTAAPKKNTQNGKPGRASPAPNPIKSNPNDVGVQMDFKTGQFKGNVNASPLGNIGAELRKRMPLTTATYAAYGSTQELMKECTKPGDYTIPQALEKGGEIPEDEHGVHLGVGTGWWYDTLGLTPTFSNWAQITFVHMYMIQVRLRMFPESHAPIYIQHLTNHAFYAAEDRLVVWHKFNANSLRQKYLKDTFSQWRAVLWAYDEGLMKGDAALAANLWRNLLSGREDVDFTKLAQIVGYMRRELKRLDETSADNVANGSFKFMGDPGEIEDVVRRPSAMLKETS